VQLYVDLTAPSSTLTNSALFLSNCVRENYNHGIGMNDLIFGENFDGDNLDTLTPLTKKRFDFLCKRIKELDPYATI
jgi:hypothetical protein